MKVKVITRTIQHDHGLYQVGISVVLEGGTTTTDVPEWMASRISTALGGNGEVELVDSGIRGTTGLESDDDPSDELGQPWKLWQIDLPCPFDGRMEFNFDVKIETPLP